MKTVKEPFLNSTLWVVFSLVAVVFGEFLDFYNTFYWFDVVLHTLAGVLLVFTVTCVVEVKDFKTLLLVGCAVTNFLVLWEVFEYGMDTYFDFNMQKDGIKDTMEDILAGKAGAFIALLFVPHNETKETT